MKVRQLRPARARIEIIPMIDVIFFLLVFFMISSLAMTRINSLPVSLPKTASSPEAIRQEVILTVRRGGEVFVNKTPVAIDAIGRHLAYEMKKNPQEIVVVNADEGVDYGLVVNVLDRARQVGVRKFALATKANAEASP